VKFKEMSKQVCANLDARNNASAQVIPQFTKTSKSNVCDFPKKSSAEDDYFNKLITLKKDDLVAMLKCTFKE